MVMTSLPEPLVPAAPAPWAIALVLAVALMAAMYDGRVAAGRGDLRRPDLVAPERQAP